MRQGLIPLALCVIAALVYTQYGFHGALTRDDAIYLYSGQRMADGVPPYVSIFDHKGPLAPVLAGLGVMAAQGFGWDDIYTVRAFFFVMSLAAALTMYWLARTGFGSTRVALFVAATFIAFPGFGREAAAGPQPKTPMLLFEILSLLLTMQQRWFLGAASGALAFLVWQPMAVFPLMTVILAAAQPAGRRGRAVVSALAGAALPVAIVCVWFWSHEALDELVEGALLFNVRYLANDAHVHSRLRDVADPLFRGYRSMILPLALGLVAMVPLYASRIKARGSARAALLTDQFAPLLVTFPAPVLWSLLDFQSYADAYVFLPYAAVGFGWALDFVIRAVERSPIDPRVGRLLPAGACVALLLTSAIDLRVERKTGISLGGQRREALQLEKDLAQDGQLLAIGAPELLVLTHRENPNRYVFIIRGIDRLIDAETEGGFAGWIARLEADAPDVIAFGQTWGEHVDELEAWLRSHYRPAKPYPFSFTVLVRQN